MSSWEEIDEFLTKRGVRIGPPTVGQTLGGQHEKPSSYHYRGLARDYGVHDSDASGAARRLEFIATQPNGPIAELFFVPLGIWYKDGRRIPGSRVGGHRNHCHEALREGGHLF